MSLHKDVTRNRRKIHSLARIETPVTPGKQAQVDEGKRWNSLRGRCDRKQVDGMRPEGVLAIAAPKLTRVDSSFSTNKRKHREKATNPRKQFQTPRSHDLVMCLGKDESGFDHILRNVKAADKRLSQARSHRPGKTEQQSRVNAGRLAVPDDKEAGKMKRVLELMSNAYSVNQFTAKALPFDIANHEDQNGRKGNGKAKRLAGLQRGSRRRTSLLSVASRGRFSISLDPFFKEPDEFDIKDPTMLLSPPQGEVSSRKRRSLSAQNTSLSRKSTKASLATKLAHYQRMFDKQLQAEGEAKTSTLKGRQAFGTGQPDRLGSIIGAPRAGKKSVAVSSLSKKLFQQDFKGTPRASLVLKSLFPTKKEVKVKRAKLVKPALSAEEPSPKKRAVLRAASKSLSKNSKIKHLPAYISHRMKNSEKAMLVPSPPKHVPGSRQSPSRPHKQHGLPSWQDATANYQTLILQSRAFTAAETRVLERSKEGYFIMKKRLVHTLEGQQFLQTFERPEIHTVKKEALNSLIEPLTIYRQENTEQEQQKQTRADIRAMKQVSKQFSAQRYSQQLQERKWFPRLVSSHVQPDTILNFVEKKFLLGLKQLVKENIKITTDVLKTFLARVFANIDKQSDLLQKLTGDLVFASDLPIDFQQETYVDFLRHQKVMIPENIERFARQQKTGVSKSVAVSLRACQYAMRWKRKTTKGKVRHQV